MSSNKKFVALRNLLRLIELSQESAEQLMDFIGDLPVGAVHCRGDFDGCIAECSCSLRSERWLCADHFAAAGRHRIGMDTGKCSRRRFSVSRHDLSENFRSQLGKVPR